VNLKKKISAWIILALASFQGFAGVKVTGVDLKLNGSNGHIIAQTEGYSNELPDLKVNGKIIEIIINKGDRFDSLNRVVSGATVSAFMINNQAVIKTILPYAVSSDAVQMNWNNNKIEIVFPRMRLQEKKETEITSITSPLKLPLEKKVVETKVAKESLNEGYLNKLINEENKIVNKVEVEEKDIVSTKMAAPLPNNETQVQNKTDSFSFAGYAAKFSFFLVLVLGLFYGVVQLLKKGLLKKGKLSFLNDSKLVEVLNTTYVAPKRSFMLVKVHKQIILVSNTETGMSFITEVKDTTGLIKDTERLVAGNNFDDSVSVAEQGRQDYLKIKENIHESTEIDDSITNSKINTIKEDVVKFSDELKKKAKRLKPIENRVN
jgi:flagellar biogenesis protein FliO